MQDFVKRLILHNPEQYGLDGVHEYKNDKMFCKFMVHGNGKDFDIIEFKRITHY